MKTYTLEAFSGTDIRRIQVANFAKTSSLFETFGAEQLVPLPLGVHCRGARRNSAEFCRQLCGFSSRLAFGGTFSKRHKKGFRAHDYD